MAIIVDRTTQSKIRNARFIPALSIVISLAVAVWVAGLLPCAAPTPAGADCGSALGGFKRLNGLPQLISQQRSPEGTRTYLQQTGIKASFTFQTLNHRSHCDDWVLRDLPERKQLRTWLQSVLKEYANLAN